MALISPSILSADFANLERDIHMIEKSGGDWVHVDVMDGLFVPNITIGLPVLKCIRRVTDLPLDVHLMIDRPIRYVEGFCAAGADILTVHLESDTPENTMAAIDRIAALGVKPAIALKPGTAAEAALPYLEKVSMILVMTVEPGFGGQGFMPETMPKLEMLRGWLDRCNPTCHLQVDGGVDRKTASVCKSSGADVLVSGSAFFRDPQREEFVRLIHA